MLEYAERTSKLPAREVMGGLLNARLSVYIPLRLVAVNWERARSHEKRAVKYELKYRGRCWEVTILLCKHLSRQ